MTERTETEVSRQVGRTLLVSHCGARELLDICPFIGITVTFGGQLARV